MYAKFQKSWLTKSRSKFDYIIKAQKQTEKEDSSEITVGTLLKITKKIEFLEI